MSGLLLAGCAAESPYPHRPITLICPWGAGGGTDSVSRQVAAHLEREMGVPVSVVNATGGKGVVGHNRGFSARPDGYTLLMATLELNMLHWSGLTTLAPDDCIPLMSVNEDYAALFVRNDAPWQSLDELTEAIRESPGNLKASGTASGGAWHLALAGWLSTIGQQADDVVWVSSTGAGPSILELTSGGLDMVVCSLPEARLQFQEGTIRCLGAMAPKRAAGYPSVPTFEEQGVDWSLGGWRGLAVPLGTPPEIVDRLVDSLEKTVTGQTELAGQTYPEFMQQETFDNTWRGPAEFREFLAETDTKFGRLLTSDAMRSVNRDPFPPMAFPNLIMILGGLSLVGLAIQRIVRGATAPADVVSTDDSSDGTVWPSRRGWSNLAVIVLCIIVYPLVAETAGFVIATGGILLVLLLWLGTRPLKAALIVVLFVPAVYQVFAHLLRVPLPRGWLGW
jgi:tripartite-type tricarboxylate transporter receptor subunit TctC